MKYMEGKYEQCRCFQLLMLLFLPIIVFVILSGCISQQPEVLNVNPEIYEGQVVYTNLSRAVDMFAVIKGNIPQVKESYEEIIVNKMAQQSTFSVDDNMNFVVSRGITPGFDINISRVEKQGNVYTVYATYIDQGTDLGILRHPVAIIPMGQLAAGDYEARLRMTWVSDTIEGRKVIEPEKELSVFNFEVKPAVSSIGISRENVSGYFDESAGSFTKKWDSRNFAGFWRDSETGVSTEALVINQSILNNSHRVIEKHNLIYTTKSTPINYPVYRHTGKAPEGTDGSYSAIGWLGEKSVFLRGNRIARIIFEQNVTDVKTMRIGEPWNMGEGYRIVANSIDADGIMQAWISLDKDNTKIDDKVLATHYTELYSYPQNVEGSNVPILVTYLSKIYSLPETDAADFKYTWLRSQNFTDVKEGDSFGIMEVTSVKNGVIELRNKEPIDLSPGRIINLMGNITIEVGNSTTDLQFYPNSTRIYRTLPSLIDTISAVHPVLKNDVGIREVARDYYFRDYMQQCCDGGLKYIIGAYPKRGGSEEGIVITLQNDYTGKERLKNIELIPEKGEAIAPEIVSIGNWSGYKSPAFMIINSRAEWDNVWQKHVNYLSGEKPSLPEIDFTNETIVAVFLGESPAYDAGLIDVTRKGENIFINMQETYPANLSSAQPYFIYRAPKIRDNAIFRTLEWEYRMPPGPTFAAAYSAAELKENTQILIKDSYMPIEFNDNDINAIFAEVAPIIKTIDGKKYDNVTAKLLSEAGSRSPQGVWSNEYLFVLEGTYDNKTEWWRMRIYYTPGQKVSIPYPDGPNLGRAFG
jgi:S-layer protein (TIGR01567 family)